MLTDLAIDTAESTLCDQNNDRKNDFCVIAGASVTLPASRTIKAFGPKPLVLLSTLGMILQGNSIIDVSSHSIANPQATGAGANPASCINGNAAALAGGGYGGSFGGQGGDGERSQGRPQPPALRLHNLLLLQHYHCAAAVLGAPAIVPVAWAGTVVARWRSSRLHPSSLTVRSMPRALAGMEGRQPRVGAVVVGQAA